MRGGYIKNLWAGKGVKDIQAKAGGIGYIRALIGDVTKIVSDQDIENIWGGKNVKDIQASNGSIDNIFASGSVNIIRSNRLSSIFAKADVKDISIMGDINLIEAMRDAKSISSQGILEVIAHRDAVGIEGADGTVFYGRNFSKISDNLSKEKI